MPYFAALYEIEHNAAVLDAEERRRLRQSQAKPVCDALYEWMVAQRKLVSEGSSIAKALDYSLKRWEALTRYLDDGHVPIDNNQAHAASGMMPGYADSRIMPRQGPKEHRTRPCVIVEPA